jgi:hypothetical protein
MWQFIHLTDIVELAYWKLKSIQNIEVYLQESGLEIAPNKCQLCIFDKKRDSQWTVGNHGTKGKGFFIQIN